MKNGFRRALCFLLVAMQLPIMAMPAYAATTGKNGLFSYTMRGNGTLTITKFDWNGYQKNTDIVIPQMIDGYTVTAIGDLAFSQGDVNVEKVELPDRKYEAKDAVLIIPNTVTTVGEKAFFNSGIGRVNIPASVNSIGAAAFCTGCLKNATVQQGNERYAAIEGALYDKKAKELLAFALDATAVPEGIVSLGEFSCMNFRSEDAHNLFPSTLKEIKNFSMWSSKLSIPGARFLEAGTIYPEIEIIGEYAFARADLNGRYWFSNVTKIGRGSFYGTTIYDDIYLYKLKEIPERAFAYASGYGGKVQFSKAEKIGKEAFMGSNMGNDLGYCEPQIIEDRAFKGATYAAVDSKYLSKIEYIGEEAFQAERYYLEMTIPASCTFIGDNAFYKKVKLKVTPGSYAEIWAQENGYEYDNGIEQDLSWLGQN